jgi:transmembrane sensor
MQFNESDKKDWAQLARYMAGEMETAEHILFSERINFSEENKKLVQQIESNWETMKKFEMNSEFDAEKAWNKIQTRFEQEGLITAENTIQRRLSVNPLLKIAAVLISGILLTSLVYYLIPKSQNKNWQVAFSDTSSQIKPIILADGSVVHLNEGAKVKYPQKFNEKQRIIEFEGEAFFDITHNPAQPFVIKAKGAEIKVLGTSFNVNTNSGSKDIEVYVETGKVELYSISDNNLSVTLEPGYIGAIKEKQITKDKNTNKNYLSWKTKYFDFTDGIELGEAIKILNKAYHSKITCADEKVCRKIIRTTFDNKPLLKALEIICFSNNLKIKEENGSFILIE